MTTPAAPMPTDPPTGPPGSDPEVVARRLHGHDPAAGHDTAGLPWAGRDLADNPFSGDTGTADPRLLAALREGDDAALVAAVAAARLVVPVVAVATEVADAAATGLAGDAHSDMATVVLTAPDGERALPAFSGIEALAAWDAAARPVPVAPSAAAQAALEEGCSVLVLDLGAPHQRVLRSSQLWALAQERPWHHPAHDEVVHAVLDAVTAADPRIVAVEARAGERGGLHLELVLVPGLDAPAVEQVTAALAAALGAPDVRVRLDAVSVGVRAA